MDINRVTPFLIVSDIDAAIAFYEKAFGATLDSRDTDPSGQVVHAVVALGSSKLELGGHPGVDHERPGLPPVGLHYYVADVDAAVAQFRAAGGRVDREPTDQPYGDREAALRDPSGITWWVATQLHD